VIARVLVVAGSDSGGGAGIQADIKTITALGAYAATAVTALTAQDTRGVHGVLAVDPAFVIQQMEVVLSDVGADALKTGMLHSAEVIEAVASSYDRLAHGAPMVVDPVMVAKGGASLLDADATGALRSLLLPRAAVLTPNLPEAEALLGERIVDVDGMRRAARSLSQLGPGAVLVKGGHLAGPVVFDVLRYGEREEVFESARIETRSTHGTGCTLASAIAASIAQGLQIRAAVDRARRYLLEALRCAPQIGSGHGPVHHGHTVRRFD
jgi:hydroxymethylpyrimidine/phosphomethylpyrimidine kinase